MAYGMSITAAVRRVAAGPRISRSALAALFGTDAAAAIERGLLVDRPAGRWSYVEITAAGRDHLASEGRKS